GQGRHHQLRPVHQCLHQLPDRHLHPVHAFAPVEQADGTPGRRRSVRTVRGGPAAARNPRFPKSAVMRPVLLGAALMCMLSPGALAADDPAASANAFYAIYKDQHAQGGVPDATVRLRYSPVLSPRLNKQLVEAAAAQARLTAKVRNAVPPMLEGDIFSSLF